MARVCIYVCIFLCVRVYFCVRVYMCVRTNAYVCVCKVGTNCPTTRRGRIAVPPGTCLDDALQQSD